MQKENEADVLIVGAGPVGLTLAIDLAWRGIDVTVVETRARAAPPEPKCNHVAARTMEIFRRLGVAGKVRNAGLPADYPHDISYRTTFTGQELTRIRIPCRRDRFTMTDGPDCNWPTPEPPHRINQIFLEPILFEHAAAQPRIRIINRTSVEDVAVGDTSASATLRDLDSGAVSRMSCRFLIGCDGARSVVRKAIGAKLSGDEVVQRVQSTYIRAPDLIKLQQHERAWGTGSINPRRAGMVYAIDGVERWLVHNYMKPDEGGFRIQVDRDACIRTILGVGPRFPLRHHLQGGLGRTPADRGQIPRPQRLHRRRRGAYLGALCGLWHERRHCRCHEPVVAAGGPSQRLGAAVHSGRLRGGALADHQPGFAIRDVACGS